MGNRVDPITFEVIKSALTSIADEMALIIMRSGYSPIVRDVMDYSTAVCDSEGQLISQGLTLPIQLGSFPDSMEILIRDFGEDLHPGDVFIYNDPYGSGGQHLPDVYVVKPIFVGNQLEGFACTMAHHSDVGGIAPGSTSMLAWEIFQEGLCLPMLKIFEKGKQNDAIVRIIERNSRTPRDLMGDIRAQIAACAVGERGLTDLVRKYGSGELRRYLDAMQDQAEMLMRRTIEEIPDGTYRFTDFIDGFGENPEELRISVALTVSGDSVSVDFAGTSKQVEAAINAPVPIIHSVIYCAIRSMSALPIPDCQGYMRPITFLIPEGTIVNPVRPAACAARGVMAYRTFDALMGALAKAVPERVLAAGEGGPCVILFAGREKGEPWVVNDALVGNWGARATLDGLEGVSNPAANLSNPPIEIVESEWPIEHTSYEFVQDSGGPGKFRGGLAFRRSYRMLRDRTSLTLRSDRRTHPPYGIAGGKPGGACYAYLIRGDEKKLIPTMPMEVMWLDADEGFEFISPGGGGYGHPFERDPDLVLNDVLDGKVGLEAARTDYGVEIDLETETVDVERTSALRSKQ